MNSEQWTEKVSNWEDVNFDDIYQIIKEFKKLEDKNAELEQEIGVWRHKYHRFATGDYVLKLEKQLELIKKMTNLDDWDWYNKDA